MPSLTKPSQTTIDEFLASQSTLDFSYAEVGATANLSMLPHGFKVDHTRARLGAGQSTFEHAREALCAGRHFDLGWVQARSSPGAEAGQPVAVLARAWGMHWLNACRVVYVVREDGPINRFGFAYGTLPG